MKRVNQSVVSDIEKAYFDDFAVATHARVGTAEDPSLVYLHGDRLGSVSTVTDGTLTINESDIANLVVQQRDFGPFGKNIIWDRHCTLLIWDRHCTLR